MKRFFCLTILSFLTTTIFAQADKILGTWLTEDKEAHIKIYKSNDLYYGKIVWLKEPNNPKTETAWLDEQNKDESKRKLPLLGANMLWDFMHRNNEYVKGSVYDSRNGAIYSGKLWLENPNTLKMRGYWGFFYSTETWTKLNNEK